VGFQYDLMLFSINSEVAYFLLGHLVEQCPHQLETWPVTKIRSREDAHLYAA